MANVLLTAVIWLVLARVAKVPNRVQALVIAVMIAVVLLIQITLAPDNPLRLATGGSLAVWLILIGAAVVAGLYVVVLRRLKSRAIPARSSDTATDGGFSETELERYARHIILREIGGAGQQKLKAAKVLVIGAGGLGSPLLLYLAAAGVGTIGMIDDDTVSLSNLQRQVLHTDDRIGMAKVFSAEIGLRAVNPHITVRPYNRRLTDNDAAELFAEYDLVLDGSDNFETRYLANKTCVALGIPLIAAAISQWEGQISLYHPSSGTPCYACVFPKAPAEGLAPSCAEAGVMGALPGVMGAMMATEAIKHISGAGHTLKGEMVIFDALFGESRKMKLVRNEECSVCGGGA